MIRRLSIVALLTVAAPPSLAGQTLRQLTSEALAPLTYRHVGPVGNRVSAVTGVPGDPNMYYIGAASGGVWKTVDGGTQWAPVFDAQPAQSIGALAVDPVNPNVVWAGTGEAFIRSNVSIGNGVYKSTDAGRTWRHVGLPATGRIGRIVVHPTNPDVVFVAALGHLYGPQPERGVFRTTDGGASWERVLFVDEGTGAVDVVMTPGNPAILFAAMWQMEITTWGRTSGGPGSGLFRSRDGGTTWERLQGRGLPRGDVGKIGLAVAPDEPQRIYALIETNVNRDYAPLDEHQGVLWRSDDGGERWRMVNADHTLAQRPLYYTRAVVAPDDHNEIHFLSTLHTVSYDGGRSVTRGNAGGDNHDMWIDPQWPDRMIVGHDGGVSISTTRGRSWQRPRLPIAQMYHVHVDNAVPYYLYGNRQDGPSTRGPSNSLTGSTIPIGAWHTVGGCESGFAVPDTVTNATVYSGCYEGILERYDIPTGHAQNIMVWPDNPEGWPAADLRYRFQWTFPVSISPHDHTRVYVGSQHVHQTTDGGHTWTVISPDLTTNDKGKQAKTGGLTPDDVSPTYAAVLFAIAESPLEPGVIWAGSNDGLVHLTRDGGATWDNLTRRLPDLPPWGTVSNIEPSRHAAGTAYLTVDLHQINDPDPYVYRTRDYGRSWTRIDRDLPRTPFGYAHVVREDPVRPGLLYLGTENALYVSFDDGARWLPLQTNLPHAPVYWLTVQPHFNDLVVATYGRGFWILDDITPLQQLTDSIVAAPVHLFAPRRAYRYRPRGVPQSQPGDPGAGRNPRYGASFHYYLREKRTAPTEIQVEDEAGRLVKAWTHRGRVGLNRVYWDLRYAPSATPRMRTPVLEHAHVPIGDDGWRPAGETGRVAPLAPPGTYTVRVTAGDHERSVTVEVVQDPRSTGSLADIREQTEMVLALRTEADSVVRLIDEIEWVRMQLRDLRGRLADTDLRAAASELDASLIDLEMQLTDLRLSGGMAGQDRWRWPRQLYAKMTSLAGYVSRSDFRPTEAQREVHARYQVLLAESWAAFATVVREGVEPFNARLRDRALGPVIVGSEPRPVP